MTLCKLIFKSLHVFCTLIYCKLFIVILTFLCQDSHWFTQQDVAVPDPDPSQECHRSPLIPLSLLVSPSPGLVGCSLVQKQRMKTLTRDVQAHGYLPLLETRLPLCWQKKKKNFCKRDQICSVCQGNRALCFIRRLNLSTS